MAHGSRLPQSPLSSVIKLWAYFALNLAVPDRFTRPPAMSPTMPPAISNSNSSELHCKVGNCLIILPSSDLKVHQRDAHGRIPCDDSNCNITFTLKSSKIRHMNTIHGEGKVPCEGCKSLFRKDKLDKGMQRCKSEFISITDYGVKLIFEDCVLISTMTLTQIRDENDIRDYGSAIGFMDMEDGSGIDFMGFMEDDSAMDFMSLNQD